ncbi:hypothetical protein [Comamonas terrae]|uniref:Uncharacterized protein n=1 Tax=Comamonas terrae TaxID=673548 RepID=A0ABW5US22_9BURK|nr:hypothetical protein [Comamonas terrae]
MLYKYTVFLRGDEMQESTNGCLGRITGVEIAVAGKTLPPADTVAGPIEVEVDALMMGRVRLRFERRNYTQRKVRQQYFWCPTYAEVIGKLDASSVKDEFLARWLRWSEDRADQGDMPTFDTAVRMFHAQLLADCPAKLHALSPDPIGMLKRWIAEDALP